MRSDCVTILTNMCMIQNEKGEVLVQDRVDKSWAGIAFPGGHIEKGESIVESTIREVKEETGLDITNLTLCGIKDWCFDNENKRYMVFLFKTSSFSGDLIEYSDEGINIWMTIDTLRASNLAPSFLNTLPLFLEDEKCEFFFDKDGGIHIY